MREEGGDRGDRHAHARELCHDFRDLRVIQADRGDRERLEAESFQDVLSDWPLRFRAQPIDAARRIAAVERGQIDAPDGIDMRAHLRGLLEWPIRAERGDTRLGSAPIDADLVDEPSIEWKW